MACCSLLSIRLYFYSGMMESIIKRNYLLRSNFQIKEAGTDIVVCFKAIDPEICHALFQNGIGAIQRVIAPEMDVSFQKSFNLV